MNDENTPPGQLFIYKDGGLKLQVRLDGQTVWLTQAQVAELYQTTPQNITLHLQSIYDDGRCRKRQLVRNSYKFARKASARSSDPSSTTISTSFSPSATASVRRAARFSPVGDQPS